MKNIRNILFILILTMCFGLLYSDQVFSDKSIMLLSPEDGGSLVITNSSGTVTIVEADSLVGEIASIGDSVDVHRIVIDSLSDSVDTHRTVINTHADSITAHRIVIDAHADSIAAHRTDINSKIEEIIEDTSPELGGDLYTGDYLTHWDNSPSTDKTATGIMTTMTYGETVALYELLFMETDGELYLADADTLTTMPAIALALETGGDADTKKVLMTGFVRYDEWNWTIGGLLYASTTPGGITQTAPSGTNDVVQIVGIAISADVIYFKPEYSNLEIMTP